MKRIGIISDTHGTFDDTLREFLKDVDEIWHAGDIGSIELADRIAAFKPLRAVSGNIDGGMIPKVRACITALSGGAKKTHIIDGRAEHTILMEIFSDKGVGTEVVKEL
jgi:acetylglutamate kinase